MGCLLCIASAAFMGCLFCIGCARRARDSNAAYWDPDPVDDNDYDYTDYASWNWPDPDPVDDTDRDYADWNWGADTDDPADAPVGTPVGTHRRSSGTY